MYQVKKTLQLPIFEFDLNQAIDATSIANTCIALKTSLPNDKPDLVTNGWQSKSFTKEKSEFTDLTKIVTDKISASAGIMYSIVDFWYIIYDQQGEQKWHRHTNDIAAVYYAQASENSAPIIFESEGQDDLIIPVRQGYLYAWPAPIHHMVPTHKDEAKRIVVSFNLRQKHFNPYTSYQEPIR
jgi:hypothetical protein